MGQKCFIFHIVYEETWRAEMCVNGIATSHFPRIWPLLMVRVGENPHRNLVCWVTYNLTYAKNYGCCTATFSPLCCLVYRTTCTPYGAVCLAAWNYGWSYRYPVLQSWWLASTPIFSSAAVSVFHTFFKALSWFLRFFDASLISITHCVVHMPVLQTNLCHCSVVALPSLLMPGWVLPSAPYFLSI